MKKTVKNYVTEGEGIKDKISKLSIYAKIFIIFALAFLIFGLSMLGSFNATGKSVTVYPGEVNASLAYQLHYQSGQKLDSVYVNVGAVYADTDADKGAETMRLRVYYKDNNGWDNPIGAITGVANIYSDNGSYESNANYNWTKLCSGYSLTQEYIRISVLNSGAAGQINEVVFLDADGNIIEAEVAMNYCETVEGAQVENTLDAQNSYTSSNSYRYNFTYEEEYILASINGIEIGGETGQNSTYVMSTDYNALGILVYALSTWIFGKSTFALRLPSFLASFGIVLLLFFFGKSLFKNDKWGLALGVIFVFSGLPFTVGSTGTPLALALVALLGSVYCMHRFYANGIDSAHPVKTALPILFSGLCGGLAFGVYSPVIFPLLITLGLFVGGVLRLLKHRDYLLHKAERKLQPLALQPSNVSVQEKLAEVKADLQADLAVEVKTDLTAEVKADSAAESLATETADAAANLQAEVTAEESVQKITLLSVSEEEKLAVKQEMAQIRTDFRYKSRLSVVFFVGSLLIALILLALAAIPGISAFNRYYATGNFFTLFINGFSQCFSVGDITPYTQINQFNPFSWLLALKGATIFEGSAANGATVMQVNVQANVLTVFVALCAFLFCSIYLLIRRFADNKKDKNFKRATKAYCILLAGAVTTLVAAIIQQNVSTVQSYAFYLFYLSFIVLALFILEKSGKPTKSEGAGALQGVKTKADLGVLKIICVILFSLILLFFAASTPMLFGWQVSGTLSKILFNWTSLISNGYYGLLLL